MESLASQVLDNVLWPEASQEWPLPCCGITYYLYLASLFQHIFSSLVSHRPLSAACAYSITRRRRATEGISFGTERQLSWARASVRAPFLKTNVGGRISWQIRILLIKKARIFHGEASSFKSYMTWQPEEPFSCMLVNSAGSTRVVQACASWIFRAPGWLCTACQMGNNSPRKQSLCYHATWEGFSLHVNVSNEQLCEGHNLHYSDCPPQEALAWLTSFPMCIISAEMGWIRVTLSHRSLGIPVYISFLAGKQHS